PAGVPGAGRLAGRIHGLVVGRHAGRGGDRGLPDLRRLDRGTVRGAGTGFPGPRLTSPSAGCESPESVPSGRRWWPDGENALRCVTPSAQSHLSAPVAQGIERLPPEQKAAGSNPAGGTI